MIIETGELKEEALIRRASEISIDAGADFIKTSTGKVPVNATPEAARIMMEVIKAKNPKVGFKPAGGVKDAAVAGQYLAMAEEILGGTGYPPAPSASAPPACWPACWRPWGMATSLPIPAVTKRWRGGAPPPSDLVRSVFVRDARRE